MIEISIIVKATVAVGAGLLASTLARHARASIRHAIIAATFAVLLVLPAAAVSLPEIAIPVPMASTAVNTPALAIPPTVASDSVARTPTVTPSVSPPAISVRTIVTAIWAIGAGVLLIALGLALWRLQRIRRTGLPWLESAAVLESLATRAGVHRSVELLLHEEVATPLTCGVLRPAIIVPQAAKDWSDAALRRALVHELEHVRRYDWCVHLAARVACAAYWFHPLVWIAYRHLALDAERARVTMR